MREKGDVLEDYVKDTWPVTIQREVNSGAKHRENDLVTSRHSIECKRKLTSTTISITTKESKQAIARANRAMREPVWVIENAMGKFIVLRYDEFCDILAETQNNGKEKD